MGVKKMFRRTMFGGFNKTDVEEYIQALEDELEKSRTAKMSLSEQDKSIIDESIEELVKLKNERDLLETKVEKLEKELKKRESDISFGKDGSENAELLIKLLAENKKLKDEIKKNELTENQQMKERDAIKKVLAEAKENARTLLLNSEKLAEEKRKRADELLKNELENKVIEFVTINYRVDDFVKEVNSISDQLKGISESLQKISTEVPAKVMDLLNDKETDIINASGIIIEDDMNTDKDNAESAEFNL